MNNKKCKRCNQNYYPFRYGICPLCGENYSDVIFVKDSKKYLESQGIKRWIEKGFRDLGLTNKLPN